MADSPTIRPRVSPAYRAPGSAAGARSCVDPMRGRVAVERSHPGSSPLFSAAMAWHSRCACNGLTAQEALVRGNRECDLRAWDFPTPDRIETRSSADFLVLQGSAGASWSTTLGQQSGCAKFGAEAKGSPMSIESVSRGKGDDDALSSGASVRNGALCRNTGLLVGDKRTVSHPRRAHTPPTQSSTSPAKRSARLCDVHTAFFQRLIRGKSEVSRERERFCPWRGTMYHRRATRPAAGIRLRRAWPSSKWFSPVGAPVANFTLPPPRRPP